MDVLKYIFRNWRRAPRRAGKAGLWMLGITICFALALLVIRGLSLRNVPGIDALLNTLDVAICVFLGLVLLQLGTWVLSLEILRLEGQQDEKRD